MTAAQVLELLTRGHSYELHSDDCEQLKPMTITVDEDSDMVDDELLPNPCDCPGPDLLKEIKEVLARA